ncbi:MAG: bifunctional demethylmenaquinone methyltransferase/2-methoxy-6-polyprenyl-1,4-benzoquinol methylase UbiE [Gilvibacter sp.]
MSQKVTPYQDSSASKKEQIEQMFDTISGKYDGLNRVISLGVDQKWRKKVVALVKNEHPATVLDIATGTGDLAIQFASQIPDAKVTGLDISQGMLDVAVKKSAHLSYKDRLEFMQADSEAMPFDDNSFDVITVSFGIRNFETLEKGLAEIYRVLAPEGLFVVLETSVPTKFPFKQGYAVYSNYVLPTIGKLFSKDKVAYNYLSKSAASFPYGATLNNIFKNIGFIAIENKPQTFGVATIYSARKK